MLRKVPIISSPFNPKAVITFKVSLDWFTIDPKVLVITLNSQDIPTFRRRTHILLKRGPLIIIISTPVINPRILVNNRHINLII